MECFSEFEEIEILLLLGHIYFQRIDQPLKKCSRDQLHSSALITRFQGWILP